MAVEPTLSEVLRDAIESRLVDVHTIKVGKVVSYDRNLQVADVQPVIQRPYNVGGGNLDFEELPIIPNVPVVWLRAGGFYVHMPLAAGDHVVLGFTDDSIAEWRQSGEVTTPDDLKRHDLGSAIAFPGIAHALGFLSVNPLDAAMRVSGMCFGADGADEQVSIGNGITVGRPNPLLKRVSPVALADRTEARIIALEAQLVALTAQVIALTAATAAAISGAITTSAAALGTHTHAVAAAPGESAPPTQDPPGAPTAAPAPPATFVPNPLPIAADILKGTGPLP